jgi:hypothetical protein
VPVGRTTRRTIPHAEDRAAGRPWFHAGQA